MNNQPLLNEIKKLSTYEFVELFYAAAQHSNVYGDSSSKFVLCSAYKTDKPHKFDLTVLALADPDEYPKGGFSSEQIFFQHGECNCITLSDNDSRKILLSSVAKHIICPIFGRKRFAT